MEFNFKSNSAYSYMKYGGYQGKYKGKEYYMVPNPEASINIRDLYDMFSKMDSILVDLLNMGRICIDAEDDQTKFTCAYFYVRNQLQEDMMYDQISIKEYKDPFNGS